ncbi:MAG: tetratricopeptide repeat protein [Pyrinomonadaceae bacterium]
MGFDKVKAMRNAERFVAQGNLRSAIAEYKSVVDHDWRDFATLNMLGDLYVKESDTREAVRCYMKVADHYNKQGFAQKAIAVYNKITKIQPDNMEVAERLAELHKGKGALGEARSHYMMVAEHHQKAGRRLEALAMYKQIALLDPNNTDVCMNLADSYVREGQTEEAVEAYAEAGERFIRQGNHEEAIRALMRGFDIKMNDLRVLNGLVNAQSALGRAGKAAKLLEDLLEDEPYNRDILYLLIECCVGSNNAAGAEKAVIKLVEIEPANYPRFLDLIRIYLNNNDAESAARILSISAEYLLAGGQAEDCGKWIDEILERDPNQLTGLRLLVRYNSWLNDENGSRLALERLYTAAASKESVEDERYALVRLVEIKPETRYRDRLNEINEKYDFADEPSSDDLKAAEFNADNSESSDDVDVDDRPGVVESVIVENAAGTVENTNGDIHRTDFPELTAAQLDKFQKDVDSIEFYIENDYHELAEKAIAEVTAEFGDRPEIVVLRKRIGIEGPSDNPVPVATEPETAETSSKTASGEPGQEQTNGSRSSAFDIDDIRSEFGLEGGEEENSSEGDYDTRYQMAVAYQEMGLMEDAIREYQDAINLTQPNDGTRRFYSCATLLGHCFLQNSMAAQAVTWLERALETNNLSDAENHGLWYELALAYEANGDDENSSKYFEKIYTENVDFRDVANRVKNLAVTH